MLYVKCRTGGYPEIHEENNRDIEAYFSVASTCWHTRLDVLNYVLNFAGILMIIDVHTRICSSVYTLVSSRQGRIFSSVCAEHVSYGTSADSTVLWLVAATRLHMVFKK